MGCDMQQGFLFGAAMTVDEAEEKMSEVAGRQAELWQTSPAPRPVVAAWFETARALVGAFQTSVVVTSGV